MSGHLYMPLWTDAYLGDTRHLTTLQHGIYVLLLMSMWRNGGTLPNDEKLLSRYAGLTTDQWRRNASTIMSLLDVEGEVVTQKRLRLELEKARRLSEKRSTAGKVGNEVKSLKNKGSGVANASAKRVAGRTAQRSQSDRLQIQIQNQIQREEGSGSRENTNSVGDEGRADDVALPWESFSPAEIEASGRTPSAPQPDKPADPPAYAFEEGLIRLNQRDYDRWKSAFPHINLEAELIGLSGWAVRLKGEGKSWFEPVKQALANKNRKAELEKAKIVAEAAAAAKRASAGPRPGQAAI